jgi:DNA-binding transcriptional regulator YiaG
MRLSIRRIFILFSVVLLFSECKKGKDDPNISFRSRNARLEGEWHISTFTKTSTNTYDDNGKISEAKINSTNDGSKTKSTYTYAYNGSIDFSIEQVQYEKINLSICKCSEAKINRTQELISITQTNYINTIDTSRNYITSEITIQSQSVKKLRHNGVYSENSYNALYEFGFAGLWKWENGSKNKLIVTIDNLGTFYVKELRNKKMVLTSSHTTTETFKKQTTTLVEDFELTFIQD